MSTSFCLFLFQRDLWFNMRFFFEAAFFRCQTKWKTGEDCLDNVKSLRCTNGMNVWWCSVPLAEICPVLSLSLLLFFYLFLFIENKKSKSTF